MKWETPNPQQLADIHRQQWHRDKASLRGTRALLIGAFIVVMVISAVIIFVPVSTARRQFNREWEQRQPVTGTCISSMALKENRDRQKQTRQEMPRKDFDATLEKWEQDRQDAYEEEMVPLRKEARKKYVVVLLSQVLVLTLLYFAFQGHRHREYARFIAEPLYICTVWCIDKKVYRSRRVTKHQLRLKKDDWQTDHNCTGAEYAVAEIGESVLLVSQDSSGAPFQVFAIMGE